MARYDVDGDERTTMAPGGASITERLIRRRSRHRYAYSQTGLDGVTGFDARLASEARGSGAAGLTWEVAVETGSPAATVLAVPYFAATAAAMEAALAGHFEPVRV